MAEAKYATYGNFSGVFIKGDVRYKPSASPGHFDRAFYITSCVETNALVGSINTYDGCTVTAGLHQAILTYPKELASEDFKPGDDIGPLAELLVRISRLPSFPERTALAKAFEDCGWSLGSDNLFRYSKPKTFPLAGRQVSVKVGDLVYGADLRNTITPMNGKVPSKGPQWEQAVRWATLFHGVFSHPITYQTQVDFGIEHTVKFCRDKKLANGKSIFSYIYGNSTEKDPFFMCPELDLAMCVLHAHSVNAPAIALQKLNQAIAQSKFPGYNVATLEQQAQFAAVLLKLLAISTYGKWHHSEKNGRWQRTRTFCQQAKWWNPRVFNTIMAEGF